MNQQEFEQRLTPAQPKGWLWKLVASTVLKWLYDNADTILPILLEKVFGIKKANRFLRAMRDDLAIIGDAPACDKTNPADPHYGESGDYDKNCNWHPWT